MSPHAHPQGRPARLERNAKPGIIGAGNWIVDTTKMIDAYPAQDTLANITSEERNNGGGAFNILVDLAKLGAGFPLHAAGLIGNDADGDWIVAQCQAQGIHTAGLLRHETAPTSYTDVMTARPTGRRTFFHQRGANRFFGPEHLRWEEMSGRIFYLGYLLLLDRLDAVDDQNETLATQVLRQAGRQGFYRVIDLVSVERPDYSDIVNPALPEIDLLICNELEASLVTGVPTRDAADTPLPEGLREAGRDLLQRGVRDWAVIHLPEGAYARSANAELWQGRVRLPREQIVGAAGAGDAFAAGLLYGLHEEWDMQDSLRLGVGTAAASLRAASTSESVLSQDECLALGAEYGYLSFPQD